MNKELLAHTCQCTFTVYLDDDSSKESHGIYIYSLNVNESNICFSFFLYIDSQSNDIEDENNVPTDQTQKTNDNEEDTFLEKFQQQQRKREKLETKEKISHQVFCPFYPEVIQI